MQSRENLLKIMDYCVKWLLANWSIEGACSSCCLCWALCCCLVVQGLSHFAWRLLLPLWLFLHGIVLSHWTSWLSCCLLALSSLLFRGLPRFRCRTGVGLAIMLRLEQACNCWYVVLIIARVWEHMLPRSLASHTHNNYSKVWNVGEGRVVPCMFGLF